MFLLHEGESSKSALERSPEILIRQIAFDSRPFFSVAVQDKDTRSPNGLEAVKPLRMFLDVSFDGNEVLMDEVCGALILIRLGVQPSAGPSSRSGTEVQKDWAILLLGFSQRLIDIFAPVHGHVFLRNNWR